MRGLAKSRNVKPTSPSIDKGRLLDSSRSNFKRRINGEYVSGNSNVDIELRSATTTKHPLLDNVGTDYDKLTMCGWERKDYRLGIERGCAISREHSKCHFGDGRRVPSDGGFLMNDEFQRECNKDNGFEPAVLSEYPSLLQSNLQRSVFARKPLLTNSLVPDQSVPPVGCHQFESQLLSNLSSNASSRDAVITSTRPFDSDAPSLSYQFPSTNGNCSSTTGGCPQYDYAENLISSSRKQSFYSYPDPKGLNKCLDKIPTYGDYVSFSGPNFNENLHQGTAVSLSHAAYSENLDADLLKHQCYSGLSSSNCSLADVPSLGTRTNLRENKSYSCNPLSPSVYSSLVDDYGYQMEPEDQLEHETVWRQKNEALMGNIALSYEDPLMSQGFVSSVDPQSLQHYENNSFRYGLGHHQRSGTLDSGPQKNRMTVFSRLALASDAYVTEHSADIDYEVSKTSTVVDGIMEMLHKNHHQWAKLKKPKQGNKQYDVEKLMSKKQNIISRKADSLKALAEDAEVDCSLAGQEEKTQLTEEKSFLNFKRRSEWRKLHNSGTTSECNECSANEGFLGGQQKKRKLVRPNFSKSGSSDDKVMKDCTSLQTPAKEISTTKNNLCSCETSIGNPENENEISFLSVQKAHVICQLGQGACEDKNPHSRKYSCHDSMVNGSHQSCHLTSDVPKEIAETGDEFVENECERNHEVVLLPSAQSVAETIPANAHDTTFNRTNSSSDQVSVLHREVDEGSVTCVDATKQNEPQISLGSSTKPSEQSFDKPEFSPGVCHKKEKLKTCPANAHEASFNRANSSRDQASELQKEVEEHSVTTVVASKENELQISLGSGTKSSEQSFDKPEFSHGVWHENRKIKTCPANARDATLIKSSSD